VPRGVWCAPSLYPSLRGFKFSISDDGCGTALAVAQHMCRFPSSLSPVDGRFSCSAQVPVAAALLQLLEVDSCPCLLPCSVVSCCDLIACLHITPVRRIPFSLQSLCCVSVSSYTLQVCADSSWGLEDNFGRTIRRALWIPGGQPAGSNVAIQWVQ
jgi:hypothetical protein